MPSSSDSEEKKVWVFFYDTYINAEVLKEKDIHLDLFDVAKLSGYQIVIQPHATLIPSFEESVFGILTTATHAELDRLYKENDLAEIYLPEAVIVQTLDLSLQPALCYISTNMKSSLAENVYIDSIVNPARQYGFPKNYIKHLESFRSVNSKM